MIAPQGSSGLLVLHPSWKDRIRKIPIIKTAWNQGYRLRRWRNYKRDFARFVSLAKAAERNIPLWADRFPCLGHATASTGFDRHYVYHTSWAARLLARNKPGRHVDISSSLYFVGIASAFVPFLHYDYRPPDLRLDNLETGFADLLKLPFSDGSVDSLSCMHVVEHVGLGRYGDPLDAEGDTKAMRELTRVLAPGGNLLFVVPIGRPAPVLTHIAYIVLSRFAMGFPA